MAISKLDTITGRMSKLMLRRWPMLAEQCSEDGCNAPLMRDPESGNTKCVWHDARELFPDELTDLEAIPMVPTHDRRRDDEKMGPESNDDDDDAAMVSPATAVRSVDLDSAQTEEFKAASLARQRKRDQSDLASQLIANRLLQGWAMIDQACPNESCYSVPLVQDREKTQLCVICGQRYMDENAYSKKYGALPPAATSSTSHSEPTTKPPPARSVPADLPTPTISAVTASSEKTAARSPDIEARPAKRRHGSAAASVAVKALEDKLAQLSTQLAEATDCRDICSISKAIGACARAIHECQTLR